MANTRHSDCNSCNFNVIVFHSLYESPRWLILKGHTEEAEKIIRDAALVNGIIMPSFTQTNEDEQHEHQGNHANYSDLVTNKEVRKITLTLWLVWFAFGFTYCGLILFLGRLYLDTQTLPLYLKHFL